MATDLRTFSVWHSLGPFDLHADIEWLPIEEATCSKIIEESKYMGDPHEFYHGQVNHLKLAHGFGRWAYKNNLVYEG